MNKENFFNNLDNIFDKKDIKNDSLSKEKYRNDWSTQYQSDPIAIVFPREVEQVVNTIKLCNEYNYPLIGSGGRTGLSGGASALSNELIVSFDKMNKILDFDKATQTVLCQPGLITQNLQSFAEENNLFYPVDFSSSGSSQIGGNIATNAGGIKVIKYGLTSKYVVGLDVVTGNGYEFLLDTKLVKDATGPDLKNFFIGSEGIFALTTSCRMQLLKKPEETNVVLIGFNDISSLDQMTQMLIKLDIEAIEFFTRNSLNQVNKEFDHVDISNLNNNYYLIVELCHQFNFNSTLEKIYTNKFAQEIIVSSNNSQKKSIWDYRLLISESISRKNPIKFDVAVPVKSVSKIINTLESFFSKNNLYHLILFGHLGDGNLHINVLKNSENIQLKDIDALEKDIFSMVLKLDGTISAEHGIGSKKVKAFMQQADKKKVDSIRNLKNHFDKNLILNPGKLIELP
jgi:FAD/FMN-containing dehydrogenase